MEQISFCFAKKAIKIINNKENLSLDGLKKKIINIKASINLGLSALLIYEFKFINPIERPIISTNNIPDPN